MNGPAPDPDKEAEEDIPMEGDGCLFSGIEVHVRIVDRDGRPGIDFPYRPAAGDRKIPEEFLEFNQFIEEGCRLFSGRFPDVMGITRFLRAVEKDGDRDRV